MWLDVVMHKFTSFYWKLVIKLNFLSLTVIVVLLQVLPRDLHVVVRVDLPELKAHTYCKFQAPVKQE